MLDMIIVAIVLIGLWYAVGVVAFFAPFRQLIQILIAVCFAILIVRFLFLLLSGGLGHGLLT
jgi:hypothetical protein